MTSVWHEVTKCVELGVPEAMDPFLQKMRAFGSLEPQRQVPWSLLPV